MSKCFFLSDLHLFASRSTAEKYRHVIDAAAASATDFVLGGDIFDFRWATRHGEHEAVVHAIGWLRKLADDCPTCRFHYLLGNHDYHHPFIERLGELVDQVDNLAWHPYHLRLGNCAFLHGDVADRPMNAEILAAARTADADHRKKGPLLNGLYDMVVMARIHKPLPHVFRPKRLVAKRILRYLDGVGLGPAHGVTDVYFGHIHRVLSNYRHGGLMFHNGGAPIKGLKFRILEANVRAGGLGARG